MEQYKPNSHRSKEEQKNIPEKKVEKVVQGTVRTKKKSGLTKLANIFISEDIQDVGSYIREDIIVPGLKRALYDIITKGSDMLIYGKSGGGKRSSIAERTSYRKYYDDRDRRSSHDDVPRTRDGYNYEDIILESRGEAEEVLERMREMIDTYDQASVADLYDLVGITGNYTDNKYGWTNLTNAEPIRVRDGYMLKLPRVLPLK